MSGNRYQPVHTGMMTGVKSDYAPVLSSAFKRNCPVCKKRYTAPERWPFTFKDHHYCSYKCYRKALADMAEKDRDKKIRIKNLDYRSWDDDQYKYKTYTYGELAERIGVPLLKLWEKINVNKIGKDDAVQILMIMEGK